MFWVPRDWIGVQPLEWAGIRCIGKTLCSNGIGTITQAADNVSPVKADVLVVNCSLLGFDMLLGMDIIRMLGGVHIDQSGNVIFTRTWPHAYAAIKIEKPDFSTEFNEKTRAWKASWKWSGNQPPNNCVNEVPEYPVSAQVQQEYRHELETWLNNGWLLPILRRNSVLQRPWFH